MTTIKAAYISLTCALLFAACASHAEEGGGKDAQNFSGCTAEVFGGRDRFIFRWSGLPSEAGNIVFTTPEGRTYRAALPWSSGETSVTGVPEGEIRLQLRWSTAERESDGPELSTYIYGEKYEENLRPWSLESSRFAGNVFRGHFSKSIPGSLAGEEFSYTDSEGNVREAFLAAADATGGITIENNSGSILHRSVYVPVPESGDAFYTAYYTITPPEHKEPTAEQICPTVDGYRGIWFTLGQVKTEYGDKYSGGLGTYTMKHIPMAVYSPEARRTYFVYGGTPAENRKYLQCMIGCYDHTTGMLQKPRVVMDKGKDGVADPHDDPTVQIDKDGYIWVFVAGRSTKRMGRRYRSVNPYDITAFEYINESYMAYPQVFYDEEKGFFLFFTRYDGVRQLFFQTSKDGGNWTPYRQLASIMDGSETKSGHYQISNMWGNKLCTAFNRHKNGNVDTRTNIYFVQSTDWGESWTTVDGKPLTLPITKLKNDALVRDYQSLGKNCYIKDVNFDSEGNPIILYLISDNYLTGPQGGVREWFTLAWDGTQWQQSKICESTHCYDSGSLWTDGNEWTVLAPTTSGPQYWGAGGEVEKWVSTDHGKTWKSMGTLTHGSSLNNTYIRRPQAADDGFYSFWADGNPDLFSRSQLYFCTRDGAVYRMPYDQTEEWQKPERIN